MLKTQLPTYFPKIKGFLWFEKYDERGYDWPIETSSTSKSAFATYIQLTNYAANSFAGLGSGKVMPLSGHRPHASSYLRRLTERPSFARVLKEAEPYFAMFPG